jgi:hypothetical protein
MVPVHFILFLLTSMRAYPAPHTTKKHGKDKAISHRHIDIHNYPSVDTAISPVPTLFQFFRSDDNIRYCGHGWDYQSVYSVENAFRRVEAFLPVVGTSEVVNQD